MSLKETLQTHSNLLYLLGKIVVAFAMGGGAVITVIELGGLYVKKGDVRPCPPHTSTIIFQNPIVQNKINNKLKKIEQSAAKEAKIPVSGDKNFAEMEEIRLTKVELDIIYNQVQILSKIAKGADITTLNDSISKAFQQKLNHFNIIKK
jgi:hypothetical protein